MWSSGFTVLTLNEKNPPVWLRLTPLKVHYGGYTFRGDAITLNLGLEATTETFVGLRPEPPAPTALPAVANYDQLEPVILRALQKR